MADPKTQFEPISDIEKYLEQNEHMLPVGIKELGHIVNAVISRTVLNKEVAALIVRLFFIEIRNGIVRGDLIELKGLGRFFLSSPVTSGTSRKIFPKFKPTKIVRDKLNAARKSRE